MWSNDPGGMTGAGPPNDQTVAFFQNLGASAGVTLIDDGVAEAIIVDGDDTAAEFDLGAHDLIVRDNASTVTVLGLIQSFANPDRTNSATFRNGSCKSCEAT